MLSYRTIEPNTLELLNKLSQLPILSDMPQWVMGTGTLVHSLGSMNLSPMILMLSFVQGIFIDCSECINVFVY